MMAASAAVMGGRQAGAAQAHWRLLRCLHNQNLASVKGKVRVALAYGLWKQPSTTIGH